jgi:hypothetical protein
LSDEQVDMLKKVSFSTAQEVLNLHNHSRTNPFPTPEKQTKCDITTYKYSFQGWICTYTLPRDERGNARYVSVFILKSQADPKAVRVDIYNDDFTFPRYYLQNNRWELFDSC